MFKKIWKFLKEQIFFNLKFNVYIFVNNEWHLIGRTQLNDIIEGKGNEDVEEDSVVGLMPTKKNFNTDELHTFTVKELREKDVLKHI